MARDDTERFEKILRNISDSLDIPPSKYDQAVQRYTSVGKWIEDGEYPNSQSRPSIFPQGSFRLGTVVRPFKGGKELDYDIDLVAEIASPRELNTPESLKTLVGDRLKENETYNKMLDPEGRRCWTLQYAEEDGVGFHLDVLPALPEEYDFPDEILITDKDKESSRYNWKSSNPEGFAKWFDDINGPILRHIEFNERQIIQKKYSAIYARVEQVPKEVIKTPLQRSIQILKRHRDVRFNESVNGKDKPISMIITTLAAQAYHGEQEIYHTITGIVRRIKNYAQTELIKKNDNGEWEILNPVNSDENFADKWHENGDAKAKAFFQWLDWLEQDMAVILRQDSTKNIAMVLSPAFGERVTMESLGSIESESKPPAAQAKSRARVEIKDPAQPWRSNEH